MAEEREESEYEKELWSIFEEIQALKCQSIVS